MKILLLGGDGFCGWPTAMHFSAQGHDVAILDSFARRTWDKELGVESLFPISSASVRVGTWYEVSGRKIELFVGCMTDYPFLKTTLEKFRPQAVIHFAEQRSAPYSMMDREHASFTLSNNTQGTLNLLFALRDMDQDCHLIKLGSMGIYGQPNISIEEGFIDVTHEGRCDRLPFPVQPGSFYHLSKVHDSQTIAFACRTWGLKATDLHQGVVYGSSTEETEKDERLINRFDYDGIFGTVLNRLCVQAAIGHNLTVYGGGRQIRCFISLRDSIKSVELATVNPPGPGEYRVINQFTEQFALIDIARRVHEAARSLGIVAPITNLSNPRVEKADHYYKAKGDTLPSLGLQPHALSPDILRKVLQSIAPYRERVKVESILPKILWAPDSIRHDAFRQRLHPTDFSLSQTISGRGLNDDG